MSQSKTQQTLISIRTVVRDLIVIVLLIAIVFRPGLTGPTGPTIPEDWYTVPYGNYVVVGHGYNYTYYDGMNFSIDGSLFEYFADLYASYFNASIIYDIPDNQVNTLVVLAHGSNNGTHIFSQLRDGADGYRMHITDDIKAEQAIYVSCSIGIIRSLDPDTQHYAYSVTDEVDRYVFNMSYSEAEAEAWINPGEVEGWGQYFYDYLIAGEDMRSAEELARQEANNYFDVSL